VDGGTVAVFCRIGVHDPASQRLARGRWKHQADPNTNQTCNTKRFHLFLSSLGNPCLQPARPVVRGISPAGCKWAGNPPVLQHVSTYRRNYINKGGACPGIGRRIEKRGAPPLLDSLAGCEGAQAQRQAQRDHGDLVRFRHEASRASQTAFKVPPLGPCGQRLRALRAYGEVRAHLATGKFGAAGPRRLHQRGHGKGRIVSRPVLQSRRAGSRL
jgi:hypothetical protein